MRVTRVQLSGQVDGIQFLSGLGVERKVHLLFVAKAVDPCYINTDYVFGEDKQGVARLNMYATFAFQGARIALIPLITFLATRIGKKTTLIDGLLMPVPMGFVGLAVLLVAFFLPVLAEPCKGTDPLGLDRDEILHLGRIMARS